jgi:D-xylose transport system substrate-binding protein
MKKTRSRLNRKLLLFLLAIVCVVLNSCKSGPREASTKIRIGFSMDSLLIERWQRDRDQFVSHARELGAEVLVQSADGNDAAQVRQCENLLTQGVNALVIVPHNGEVMASIVNSAARQHVPVISYDRLIRNSDVNLYISYDNVKVGELQARYLLEHAPKGNYVLIGGSPTDNNARMLREGQMKALQPAIDRGDIKIVANQWTRDWLASEALNHTENALTQARNNIVAVVASNDSTAGGAVQALQEQKLAGKTLVSGQDAELAAAQRIIAGTQSMTVYKPIIPLAHRAAEAAIALAKGEKIDARNTINNGMKDVPSILLDPIVVDKSNLAQTIIKDGFLKVQDVYRNVPESQWPTAGTASH